MSVPFSVPAHSIGRDRDCISIRSKKTVWGKNDLLEEEFGSKPELNWGPLSLEKLTKSNEIYIEAQ